MVTAASAAGGREIPPRRTFSLSPNHVLLVLLLLGVAVQSFCGATTGDEEARGYARQGSSNIGLLADDPRKGFIRGKYDVGAPAPPVARLPGADNTPMTVHHRREELDPNQGAVDDWGHTSA